jgi:hypothetical protein
VFHGPGLGILPTLVGLFTGTIAVVAVLVGAVIVVILVVLVARFLWFGTRASLVYLEKNGESTSFVWNRGERSSATPAQLDASPRKPMAPPSPGA